MSEKDTTLPPDDEDLRLARMLAKQLETSGDLNDTAEKDGAGSTVDPLYQTLLEYKQQAASDADTFPTTETTERIWSRVKRATRLTETPPARRRVDRKPNKKDRSLRPVLISSRTWMALAASIVILIGLGWFFRSQPLDAPVLVASAETQIVSYETPDGSTIQLRPHSKLYALDSEDTEDRYQLQGEGFFDVSRDDSRTFSVMTGDGTISVLGTRFNVSTWGKQTVVFLEEGIVQCQHEHTSETIELEPGQRCILSSTGIIAELEADATDEYTDWMNNEMVFEQRSISMVLAELGYHYDVTFDVPADLMVQTLSGRMLLGQRDQTLHDLGLVMGGSFEESALGVFRFSAE